MKAQPLLSNFPAGNLFYMETKDTSLQFVVIDDDTINNMVCKAAIKSATGGKLAVCYNNPAEGLNYFEKEYIFLKKEHHTILFLDLNMPEMSGWEWLEKYNNFPDVVKEKVTIYILSSSVNPIDIDQAHSNRLVKNYVVKPLTKAKIIELMRDETPSQIIELKAV